MNLLKKCFVAVLVTQGFFAALHSQTKGLLVTIDQRHLQGIDDDTLRGISAIMGRIDTKNFGSLGEVIAMFRTKITADSSSKDVINAWDESRAEWVRNKVRPEDYKNLYIITGDDLRNDALMKEKWAIALAENDVVDYASIVHGGDQFIKDSWGLGNTDKLRMVYSSACKGGSGKEHFIRRHHAAIAAGHTGNSASPLFTHAFLAAWLRGDAFDMSLAKAYREGSVILASQQGMMLAQLFGGFTDKDEILEESQIAISLYPGVDAAHFTINSSNPSKEHLRDENISELLVY